MYREGDWKAVCDRCGFSYASSELRTEPRTGCKVCARCYDPTPQQEVPYRPPVEQSIPWARPRATPTSSHTGIGIGYWAIGKTLAVAPYDMTTQMVEFENWLNTEWTRILVESQ